MWSLCFQHFSERKDSILNGFRLSLKFYEEIIMIGNTPFHCSIIPFLEYGVNYIYHQHSASRVAMVRVVPMLRMALSGGCTSVTKAMTIAL